MSMHEMDKKDEIMGTTVSNLPRPVLIFAGG